MVVHLIVDGEGRRNQPGNTRSGGGYMHSANRFLGVFARLRPADVFLASLVAFFVGVRLLDLDRHVTYIDELLVLTAGRWSFLEAPESPSSLLSFLSALMFSDQSSYAPGQFLFSYFLFPPDHLSVEALVAGRIVTVAMFLVGAIFGLLALRRAAGRDEWRAGAVFTILIGCSAMSLVNSQQLHSYFAGVSGVLVGAFVVTAWLADAARWRRIAGIAVLSLLPVFNYQLILATAAGAGVLGLIALQKAWVSVRGRSPFPWRSTLFDGALILAAGAAVLCWQHWMTTNKGALQVAWWVQPWILEDKSPAALIGGIGTNLVSAVEAILAFPGLSAGVPVFGLVGTFSILAGLILGVMRGGRTMLLATFATLIILLFVVGAAMGMIPLAPSRHSLILLPSVALLCALTVACGIDVLSKVSPAGGRAAGWVSLAVALTSAAYAMSAYHATRSERAETFNARLIAQALRENDLNTIVTSWWDTSKVAMLMKEEDIPDLQIVGAIGNPGVNYPHGRFLLVGQNPRLFTELYQLSAEQGFAQTKLLSVEKPYDFEPSTEIEYWPNEFHMWLVDRR